jgi:hypothetical protein
MSRADVHGEYRQLQLRRRNLNAASMVVLALLTWSLVRGVVSSGEGSLAQPLFERLDAALTSKTLGFWRFAPPFDLPHPLAGSNIFGYVCVALFVSIIVARNRAWSGVDRHVAAQREVEQERLRDRYRDENRDGR